ncbi:TetR family transcriptional regulator [Nocardioides humi]|uniref:HTH tetR-type domain-containing protein n=1 Tax=Nocardioides humi TaxID=449461 RepID=A0ABN1ZWK4_9ACTN|nr:TetR family transcriptional regulator [Nocardioides humi]
MVRARSTHREAILDSATDLFHRQGFSRTTTDQIAAGAQITKRTMYRYFSSKESLLLAIHEQFLERLLRPIDLDGTPRHRLTQLIENYVHTVVTHGDQIRVFFEERKNLSPENAARVVNLRDEHERLFRETLTEGVKTGEFRRIDVPLTAEGVLGAIASLYQWYDPDGWLPPADLASVICGLFLDGMSHTATTFSPTVRRRRPGSGAPTRENRSRDPRAAVEAAELLWAENPVLTKILDTAAAMFYDRGYDNTNTRELAVGAGLTKSALYYYIPNKEAVLYQLNLRLSVQGLGIERDLIEANPDPVDALRAVIEWQCKSVSENLGALRALSIEMRFLDEDHYDQIQLVRSEYSRLFTGVVQEAGGAWAVPKLSRPVALVVLGMVNFMNHWYTPDGRLSPDQIGSAFFELVWQGISQD